MAIGYACCGQYICRVLLLGLQALHVSRRVMYRFLGGASRILMECLIDLALLAVCTFVGQQARHLHNLDVGCIKKGKNPESASN
eukprot:259749-Amphidinium_carterae.1